MNGDLKGPRMAALPPRAPDDQPVSPALLRALAAHPDLAADLVQALNVTIHSAHDLLELMGRTSREAVRLLAGVHWAGVTAQFDGQDPFTAAHTDEKVLIVDEHQYAQHDGPCLRAVRTDRPVHMSLEEVEASWPQLADGARTAGVHSFAAFPLHIADRAVGSLNLYSADPGSLAHLDPDVLSVLSHYLSRGLTQYAAQRLESVGASLRTALAGRAGIERAIGILMATGHRSPAQARDILCRQAEDAGRTPEAHAEQIITGQLPPLQ